MTALDSIDFSSTFVFMPFYHEHEPDLRTRILKEEVAYLRGLVRAAAVNRTAA